MPRTDSWTSRNRSDSLLQPFNASAPPYPGLYPRGLVVPPKKHESNTSTNWKWYLGLLQHPVFAMISFFLLGTICATGHHIYYLSLNGKAVDGAISQQWATSVGIGLSLLSKCSWAICVRVAHLQWSWLSIHRSSMSVAGIDSLLESARDLKSFKNLEIWKHAKVATVLAGLCWSLPLSVFIAPAALTIKIAPKGLHQSELQFNYDQARLYISYGVLLLLTALSIAAGILAYINFPQVAQQSFSSILRTTRSQDLDRIAWERFKDEDFRDVRMQLKEEPRGTSATRYPCFVLADTNITANYPQRTTVRYG